MSLIEKIDTIERLNNAADELARRSDEYLLLAEKAPDDLTGYRWAKRGMRAMKAASRCMDRSEALLAAVQGRSWEGATS